MNKLFALAFGVAAFAAVPASATITLSTTGSGTGENIQFEATSMIPGLTQVGDLNSSNTQAFFDTSFTAGVGSLGGNGSLQFFNDQGQGQASLVCSTPQAGAPCGTGGGNGNQLTSMEIKPQAGIGWGQFIANMDFGEGIVNVYAQDNMGNNFDFQLTNGSNFFELTASNGEAITDVQLSQRAGTPGPFGFNDLKQPRINGACVIGTNGCELIVITSEPSTLAILGVAVIGLLGLLRLQARHHLRLGLS